MEKHKHLPAITDAARTAANQLVTFGVVEAMARKVMAETEQARSSRNFAEFLLSGEGSRAIVKIGNSVFRIEG